MTEDALVLDLDDVRQLVGEALSVVRQTDGVRVPAGNNPTRQTARRDLMYLADTLSRASAEAKAAYWLLSDRSDPLSSGAPPA